MITDENGRFGMDPTNWDTITYTYDPAGWAITVYCGTRLWLDTCTWLIVPMLA
ncbi:MAG TPA: hypothetical protein VMW72_01605 [Sedimentisphaerales bacterium]|nr:hypothetical protein [Sedimentisphaerales bacterium]